MRHLTSGPLIVVLWTADLSAQSDRTAAAIHSYITPYALSNNFAGDVLIEKNGSVLFERAYGFADRERHIPNTKATRFHIASVSMQFTAATVLRLVDAGALNLDSSVAAFLPGTEGADKITIRDLLTERSGLPDINDLPDYDDLLQHHQTPGTLVAKVSGRPLLFEPGSQSLHEEHSAYNLLALIAERKTGLPFGAAVQRFVFQPLGLEESFIDDDSPAPVPQIARGYQPTGSDGLTTANAIHWSAKTGNASVCTTVGDEARWVRGLFRGQMLSPSSRAAVLDTSSDVGYGWDKGTPKGFGEAVYRMSGRSPGFSSFVLYLPRERLTVVVFSNIYSSVTTTMGYDLARIAIGQPYESFRPAKLAAQPVLQALVGTSFQFGPDFYQKDARLDVVASGKGLALHWPSGTRTALVPLGKDAFMDRFYWLHVSIDRDDAGHPVTLVYDRFRGGIVPAP